MDRKSLDVSYHANKNAWMTRNVFKLWREPFGKRVAGRKIILIFEDFSAHNREEDLEDAEILLQNTTLFYLPPNATSKIHHRDDGTIRNFRAYYRRRFNLQLLDLFKNNQPDAATINVLEEI